MLPAIATISGVPSPVTSATAMARGDELIA